MSPTTPTIFRLPAIGIFTTRSIGSTPLKYRRATVSFTIATFGPSSLPSNALNTRPLRSGTLIA